MGRIRGAGHKKLHFKLELKNPVDDSWYIKGEYPTIKSMADVMGLSYSTVQNIILNRQKRLTHFVRITKIT